MNKTKFYLRKSVQNVFMVSQLFLKAAKAQFNWTACTKSTHTHTREMFFFYRKLPLTSYFACKT